MKPIQKIDYRGCEIQIFHDPDPIDPRGDDNLTTMICFHRNYRLGDDKASNYWKSIRNDCRSWSEFEQRLHEGFDIVTIKPLYLYDHSGITMRTHPFRSRWDSGQVGYVLIDRDTVKEFQNWKYITKKRKEKLEKWLESDVEVYDQYLTGEVYGYEALTPSGEHIDSCWGFFGYNEWDENGLFNYAKPEIDYYIKSQKDQYLQKLKTIISNRVPIIKRPELLTKPDVLNYVSI